MHSVYIRKDFHTGLRRISRQRKLSVGALVNELVRDQLEDVDDARVADARRGEPTISQEGMRKRLNDNGAL